MANWGQADFDSRTPEQQAIDREAPELRKKLIREGHMYGWLKDKQVQSGYSPQDVKRICVENANWQKVRISMKGIPTHEKLKTLRGWWDINNNSADALHQMGREAEAQNLRYQTEVQVGNYLGALRRGGQLDMHNQVRRYI